MNDISKKEITLENCEEQKKELENVFDKMDELYNKRQEESNQRNKLLFDNDLSWYLEDSLKTIEDNKTCDEYNLNNLRIVVDTVTEKMITCEDKICE